jgi:DMSO/TMAO reductase YedYZ molybdopterin-dependent catalytic subunit
MPSNSLLVSRRYWFQRLALSLAGTTGLFARRQTLGTAPLVAVQDFAQYPSVLTPNADFFVRNHFAQPSIHVSNWTLRVDGAVKHPQTFRYGDLKSLKRRVITAVLECAGNGVGDGAVSCAVWSGPMLSDLLRGCGLETGARYVRFIAADRGIEPDSEGEIPYTRSIAVDEAMGPETLLALQMNGGPLPPENGFPVRLLRAGSYGMDSVKWLERIEVLTAPDKSFFTAHRYLRDTNAPSTGEDNRIGPVQIKSIIVQPVEAAVIRGPTIDIGGYAWAGREQISRVEVTMDRGRSWQRSQLLTDSQPFGWVPWRFLWERAQPGVQSIAVRAFGESKGMQPSTRNMARLDKYELNYYHQVSCKVTA